MSHLRNPPFRAEHIGSLLRPTVLLEKRKQFEAKHCTTEELKAVEDDAIRNAVRLQQDAHINTITDGEFRRGIFFEGVFEKLDGMTCFPNKPITDLRQYAPPVVGFRAQGVKEVKAFCCTGKIKRTKPFYKDQFEFLKSLLPPEDMKRIKVTMCSPAQFHARQGPDMTYDTSVYQNDDQYFDDLATAYREEIRELYDLGCRHIQFDDPTFAYFCSEAMISGMTQANIDHEALLDSYIRAINLCVRDRPADLTIGLHICRGNFTGGVHFSEGSYDRIAVKLFRKLNVNTYYLEYDTERAGDFTPLKHLPLGKSVVLGLVTTKSAKMELIEELKERVYEAAEIIAQGNPKRSTAQALDQLCISTQCGFASAMGGNPVTEEDEKKKLVLLVEAAKQIWPEGH